MLRLFSAAIIILHVVSASAQSHEKIIDGDNVYLMPHETKRLYRFNTVTRAKEMVLEFSAAPQAFFVKGYTVYALVDGGLFAFDLKSKSQHKIQDFNFYYSDFIACGEHLFVYAEPGLYRIENDSLVKLDVATDQFHAVACNKTNTEILALERRGLRTIKIDSVNSVSSSVQSQNEADLYGVQGWLSPDGQLIYASNGVALFTSDSSVGARLRPGIVDLSFFQNQPVALESQGRLSFYTDTGDLITQVWVPAKTQFLEVVNDTVYLFQIINSELLIDSKVITADLVQVPGFAKRSSYSYALTDNRDQIFLVDVEKRLIKRWSLQLGAFLPSIALPSAPLNIYFSVGMDRLFVEYLSKEYLTRIEYYEFKDGVVTSGVFAADVLYSGEFFTLLDKAFIKRPESDPTSGRM
ncbi:MAG: hypothetical protein EOP48_23930, partial [Sphingobacteriales bacterium]